MSPVLACRRRCIIHLCILRPGFWPTQFRSCPLWTYKHQYHVGLFWVYPNSKKFIVDNRLNFVSISIYYSLIYLCFFYSWLQTNLRLMYLISFLLHKHSLTFCRNYFQSSLVIHKLHMVCNGYTYLCNYYMYYYVCTSYICIVYSFSNYSKAFYSLKL